MAEVDKPVFSGTRIERTWANYWDVWTMNARGDFAVGQRTVFGTLWLGTFATGQRTTSVLTITDEAYNG